MQSIENDSRQLQFGFSVPKEKPSYTDIDTNFSAAQVPNMPDAYDLRELKIALRNPQSPVAKKLNEFLGESRCGLVTIDSVRISLSNLTMSEPDSLYVTLSSIHHPGSLCARSNYATLSDILITHNTKMLTRGHNITGSAVLQISPCRNHKNKLTCKLVEFKVEGLL